MRDFIKHGIEARTFKGTLLWYLAMIAPGFFISMLISLIWGKEEGLECCPYLALITVALAYIYAYWPEITYFNDQLGKYANKHPGVFMGLLMGFSSFIGIAFGIWSHIWPIAITFSIMSFVGFVFAFLSRNNPRE